MARFNDSSIGNTDVIVLVVFLILLLLLFALLSPHLEENKVEIQNNSEQSTIELNISGSRFEVDNDMFKISSPNIFPTIVCVCGSLFLHP